MCKGVASTGTAMKVEGLGQGEAMGTIAQCKS